MLCTARNQVLCALPPDSFWQPGSWNFRAATHPIAVLVAADWLLQHCGGSAVQSHGGLVWELPADAWWSACQFALLGIFSKWGYMQQLCFLLSSDVWANCSTCYAYPATLCRACCAVLCYAMLHFGQSMALLAHSYWAIAMLPCVQYALTGDLTWLCVP